jgi:uncharacterized membrane protein YqaE (UPF0057 family)
MTISNQFNYTKQTVSENTRRTNHNDWRNHPHHHHDILYAAVRSFMVWRQLTHAPVPPAGAFLVAGCGVDLIINICFTILGYLLPSRTSSRRANARLATSRATSTPSTSSTSTTSARTRPGRASSHHPRRACIAIGFSAQAGTAPLNPRRRRSLWQFKSEELLWRLCM